MNIPVEKWQSHGKRFAAIAFLLAVLGVLLSGYTVYHHVELKTVGVTNFSCNLNDQFSCDKVAGSQYGEIFGLPLGVFGIGYFLGIMLLLTVAMVKEKDRTESVQTYAVLVAIGVVTSIVLACISAFVIGYGCIACIGVYIVTLLQALNVWGHKSVIPKRFSAKKIGNGGIIAAIGVAAAIFGYHFVKPEMTQHAADVAQSQQPPPVMELLPSVAELKVNKSDYSGLGQDYRKGNDEAKVTIVEFADFECPACKHVGEMLKDVYRDYDDKILIVFKNYPLNSECNPQMQSAMHKHACKVATLARCAGQKGKFWEYHDLAFAEQESLTAQKPEVWAGKIGLSQSEIKSCLSDKSILAKIRDDVDVGTRANVDGTPSLYINGRKYIGQRSKAAIAAQIDSILNED